MSTFLKWGVSPDQARKSEDWRCPGCGWDAKKNPRILGASVAGFAEIEPLTDGYIKKIGVLVIECPECSERFRFHVDESFLISIINFIDHWPDKKSAV
jgi:hypothetical protein